MDEIGTMRTLLVIALLLTATGTWASDCREEAVLHGKDFYSAKYHWTDLKSQSFVISIWDSPSLVVIVGKLFPGAQATIIQKTKTHCQIIFPNDKGSLIMGWISLSHIKEFIEPPKDSCFPPAY